MSSTSFRCRFNESFLAGTILCQVCEEEINVKDSCYRNFFVTLDIKDEIQSIIENNSDYYTTYYTTDILQLSPNENK